MESVFSQSALFYFVFSIFIFYQQLHLKNFRGASKGFEVALGLSVFTGMITGIVYLVYYGWTVIWWAPICIIIISLISTMIGAFIEKIIGAFALSMVGFIAWPILAYFMFKYIPNVS